MQVRNNESKMSYASEGTEIVFPEGCRETFFLHGLLHEFKNPYFLICVSNAVWLL